MRVLHTSDWHVGKALRGRSRAAEHEAVLAENAHVARRNAVDLVIVAGLFALTRKEVNSAFVAILLTVVGYSINDTIVVFDRIRENLRLNPGEALNPVINFSIMQTMTRSIVTGLTVVFMLLALYLFGGFSMRNFAPALLVGVISGTYSSIFNASQIVSLWQEVEDRLRHRATPAPA